MFACTCAEEPVPTATRMITAPTPISTPRIVSSERSLFVVAPGHGDPDGVEPAHATLPRQCGSSARCEVSGGGAPTATSAVVLDDLTVAQAHDALRERGDVRLVGDQHHGPALGVQAAEHAHHVLGGRRVEIAGRLVGEHHRRVGHDRARNGDPLLLAAGHLARQVRTALGEADRRERAASRARVARRGWTPA